VKTLTNSNSLSILFVGRVLVSLVKTVFIPANSLKVNLGSSIVKIPCLV